MQTKSTHELRASTVSAEHNWQGKLSITVAEVVGDTTHEVKVELSPEQMKQLMKQSRNSLIDAKVIRGKKTW